MTEQSSAQPGAASVGESAPTNGLHPTRGLEEVEALMRQTLGLEQPADEGPELEPETAADETPPDDPELALADPDESAKPPEENAGAGDPAEEITEILGLAESAGIDAETLYGPEVPLGDELDPVTLGALKDTYQDAQRIESKRLELEEDRSDFQNEMIRARGELAELINLLGPGAITPELVNRAQQMHADTLDEQRRQLVGLFPEWKDPEAFQAGQDFILASVEEYGFGRADLNGIHDHRVTKLLHDFARMKQRIANANQKAKDMRKAGTQKRGQGRAPSANDDQRTLQGKIDAARNTRDQSTKVSAISDLLRQSNG